MRWNFKCFPQFLLELLIGAVLLNIYMPVCACLDDESMYEELFTGERAVSHTKIHSAQFGKSKNESMEHGTTVRMARTKINETHAESDVGNRRW